MGRIIASTEDTRSFKVNSSTESTTLHIILFQPEAADPDQERAGGGAGGPQQAAFRSAAGLVLNIICPVEILKIQMTRVPLPHSLGFQDKALRLRIHDIQK